MATNKLKAVLLQLCQDDITLRLNNLKSIIEDLQQSLQSETKSSAGDKHETGRAMVQLEREKAGQQLAEIQKTQVLLSKINVEHSSKSIGLGSVVLTTKTNYFISISAGELKTDNKTFYAISPSTPIGLLLLGKSVGDSITFRNNTFEIKEIS
jgi:transcription elongation GreA/GreB family factor